MGQTLYVGSCSGIFYAFDTASGELRWSYDTGSDGQQAQFHGNPLVTDEWVITPSDSTDEGYTYAFDLATGQPRWKQPTDGGGGITTDLKRVGTTAVGVTRSGDLVCFGLDDGFVLWSFSPDAYTFREKWAANPALAGERIVHGGADGAVYALDANTGDRLWKLDLGAHVSTAVHVEGGDVYVGLDDFRIVRLKLASGAVIWEMSVDGVPAGFPLVSGDTMVLLLGFGYESHDVLAIDMNHGEERWRSTGDAPWSTVRLFPWGNTVLAGTEGGTLKAFRIQDGSVEWTLSLKGQLRGMGQSGELVYVGTIDGMLYALKRDDLKPPKASRPTATLESKDRGGGPR